MRFFVVHYYFFSFLFRFDDFTVAKHFLIRHLIGCDYSLVLANGHTCGMLKLVIYSNDQRFQSIGLIIEVNWKYYDVMIKEFDLIVWI